jgi:hypothetical protein
MNLSALRPRLLAAIAAGALMSSAFGARTSAGVHGWTADERTGSDVKTIFSRHPNGLKAGQFTTVAVWYTGTTSRSSVRSRLWPSRASAGFCPVRFDQLESDTTNNESSGDLNWTRQMSKG